MKNRSAPDAARNDPNSTKSRTYVASTSAMIPNTPSALKKMIVLRFMSDVPGCATRSGAA
jgi:hypothetical protein